MDEEKREAEGRFYKRCAELLCVPDTYSAFPYRKRTRWNNRAPGNGRFEGFGLIRLFGNSVHMMLKHPYAVNRFFPSKETALLYLEEMMANR